MSAVKNAVIRKMIEGAIVDLMIRTSTENVVDGSGKTLSTILSEIIADVANTPTTETVDQRIKTLIGAAPEALDTLVEIASALDNDPNFAATITNALSNKVDKVSGKGLSTNDFTTALKTKLEGLSNYSHPATHSADMIIETNDKQFVTAAEKAKISKAARVLSGTTQPADLTENDLFLQIIE